MTDDVTTSWPELDRRDPADQCWSCLTHSDDPPTSGLEPDGHQRPEPDTR